MARDRYQVVITLFGNHSPMTLDALEREGFHLVFDKFEGKSGELISKVMLCKPLPEGEA